ncbi:MAG: MotA/TolQ/ExbB proton channel family protein [Calditrichia bacterium]
MKKALDIATVAGFVIGIIAIIGSILAAGSLAAFIDIPSALVVSLGTIAAILINYPLSDITGFVAMVMQAVQFTEADKKNTIEMMVKFAEEARKDGLLALEAHIKEIDDKFIKGGLQLAIDGTEPELLSDILEAEIANMEERHKKAHGICDGFGAYAPAFGMIGTLIGLVLMLQNMSDPASIGPSMAVALITTFYGAIIANLIFIPLGGKLKERTKEEVQVREMIIAGILSIQSGDNPRLVEQKLMAFLPPKDRKSEDGND